MMAEQEVEEAGAVAGGRKGGIAGGAGPFGQAGARGEAGEGEDLRRQAEAREPVAGQRRFRGRVRPQAMIDDEGRGRSAAGCRPVPGQQREAEAVGAPGDREAEAGRGAEGRRRREGGREVRGRDRRGVLQQPSFLCWAAMGWTR